MKTFIYTALLTLLLTPFSLNSQDTLVDVDGLIKAKHLNLICPPNQINLTTSNDTCSIDLTAGDSCSFQVKLADEPEILIQSGLGASCFQTFLDTSGFYYWNNRFNNSLGINMCDQYMYLDTSSVTPYFERGCSFYSSQGNILHRQRDLLDTTITPSIFMTDQEYYDHSGDLRRNHFSRHDQDFDVWIDGTGTTRFSKYFGIDSCLLTWYDAGGLPILDCEYSNQGLCISDGGPSQTVIQPDKIIVDTLCVNQYIKTPVIEAIPFLLINGNVDILGNLSKLSGSFRIDHPQDPYNKYLYHSFVESPDMMNVYNGNIVTDDSGKAVVSLPAYFESLNIDYRYQLTVIGSFAQAIISKEVCNNQFEIMTDKPNVKVSWQITGIRNDAFARENRITAEVLKNESERGKLLYNPLCEPKSGSD